MYFLIKDPNLKLFLKFAVTKIVSSTAIHLLRKWKSLSRIRLFAIPWTVACQAPLFVKFSRQEYWSGLPFLFQDQSIKYAN